MVECAIVENKWDKGNYDFEYAPSDKKYSPFNIAYWSGHTPVNYRSINDTDVYLNFRRRRVVPKLFEKKYIPLLKDYLKTKHNWKSDLVEVEPILENDISVGDILRELKIDWLSISYGHTRTILNAFDRVAVSYAKSFSSAIIIFKKRGGYLAYYITKPEYSVSCGKASEMNALKAMEIIKDIHDNPKDNINFNEDIEEEIREHEMIQRL